MEDRPFSDISYELFLNQEKLMGSKCKGCGTQYVPPVHLRRLLRIGHGVG